LCELARGADDPEQGVGRLSQSPKNGHVSR